VVEVADAQRLLAQAEIEDRGRAPERAPRRAVVLPARSGIGPFLDGVRGSR